MEVSTIMIIMGSIYAACVLAGAIVVFVLTLKNRGTVKEAVQAVQDFVSATKGNSMVKMNVEKSEEPAKEEVTENAKVATPVEVKTPIITEQFVDKLIDNLSDEEAARIFTKLFERFIK